ncbi:MAG: hypothetical protein PHC29_08690 [Candidatus Omnitrophica bacterium]|nr:hypothetical protein [Candidatus Omnitrophota bacterium]
MSIFSKKQEVKLEDFCHDFYEKNILNPILQGIDAGAAYYDIVRKSIIEADQRFSKITLQELSAELIPLRFELFALAWIHRFTGKFAIAQSAFTKHYLHEKGKNNIWNGMGHYNKVISHYITLGLSEINKDRLIRNRADLADRYIANAEKNKVVVDESIGRPINRMFSENAWKRRIILSGLVLSLWERLGFDQKELNEEAGFRLAVVIRGLYDGALQALEKIKIRS